MLSLYEVPLDFVRKRQAGNGGTHSSKTPTPRRTGRPGRVPGGKASALMTHRPPDRRTEQKTELCRGSHGMAVFPEGRTSRRLRQVEKV